MSNVIPFPLTTADRAAEWIVDVSLSEEAWWEVRVLRSGRSVHSAPYGTYAEAWAAGHILHVLHGFQLFASEAPSRRLGAPRFTDEEIPF